MLRCSNATAFRTQFTTSIALRTHLSSPWTRAPQRLLPLTHGATKEGQFAVGKTVTVPRRYSSSLRGPLTDFEEAAQSEEVSLPSRKSRPLRQNATNEREDPLMQAAMGKTSSASKQAVKLELAWLKDRIILAERVRRLLNQNNIALAAGIVRAAQSQGIDCIAAWNHILGYCLDKKNPKAAFRFWNDMKKRGRRPNERSYTIMFEGISKARVHDPINPVRVAQTIYRSISDPTTSTKPNIIHTNAMLKVCWRHGNMDLLWEIAADLPEDGPGSPDTTTYSIILNAIVDSVEEYASKLKKHELAGGYNKQLSGVAEGKRIWADVVYRWKRGQLALDNKLVSAMARVLWTGAGERHLYEVLQLYHQTTGVPILAEEPSPDHSKVSRRANASKLFRSETEEAVPFVDDRGRLLPAVDAPEHFEELKGEEQEDFDKLFDPVVSADAEPYSDPTKPQSTTPHYIPIGNRELSVILETCLQMTNAVQVGKAYWTHLTQGDHGYRFQLDGPTFAAYLRILRVGRSSRLTVDVLRDQMVPTGNVFGISFHIAMTTCSRDRKNPNVLKHANELLRLMDANLMLPNHKVIAGYLALIRVLEENPQRLDILSGLDAAKHSPSDRLELRGRKLLLELRKVAVQSLRPHVAKFEEAMAAVDEAPLELEGLPQSEKDLIHKQAEPGHLVVTALTQVRMLIDSILKSENESLLTKEERKQYEKESVALRKYSKPEYTELYRFKRIYPTVQQQDAFLERSRNASQTQEEREGIASEESVSEEKQSPLSTNQASDEEPMADM
ncbi:hypothetical protein BDV12DRAFT_163196 [Aspergillus spectabilis]